MQTPTHPIEVFDLDLVPLSIADPAFDLWLNHVHLGSEAEWEVDLAGDDLQGNEVVLLVVAPVVEQKGVAGTSGEAVTIGTEL